MITALVADDQALVRAGFAMMLEAQPDIQVLAQVGDGRDAVQQTIRLRPDVVLMDVRMPQLNGIQATAELARAGCAARVLILTTFHLDEYVYAALKAGASGFLLKDVDPPDLVTAVRCVARGEALLAPAVTRRLIEQLVARPMPGAAPREVDELTERETRGTPPDRPWTVQRRDRPGAVSRRADRQDPRHPHATQARPT